MSVDREYRIRIQTVGDPSGANATAAAVDQLAGAEVKAGKAAEAHGTHLRALHKVFHSLNEVVPGLGVLLQAAFSPIGATISLAVMGLRLFQEKMKEFDEACRKAAEDAAKPLTKRLEEQRDTVVRSAQSLERLRERLSDAAKAEQTLQQQTQATSERFRDQAQAAEALAEATKANELAGLEEQHAAGLLSTEEYEKQKLEIQQKYAEKKRELAEREEMLEILIRKRALQEAGIRQPELTSTADAAAKRREVALENLNAQDMGEISNRRAETRKALADFQAKIPEEWLPWFEELGRGYTREAASSMLTSRHDLSLWQSTRGFKGLFGAENIGQAYETWEKLTGSAASADAEWRKAPAERARLTVESERAQWEAEAAAKRAEDNQRFMTEGQLDVEERRARFDERHRANQELSAVELDTVRRREDAMALNTPAGRAAESDVAGAVAIAQSITQHKGASLDDQRRLWEVASAIAGHGVTLQQAVGMMDSAARNHGLFVGSVTRLANILQGAVGGMVPLKARLDSLEAEVRNLQTYPTTRTLPGSP